MLKGYYTQIVLAGTSSNCLDEEVVAAIVSAGSCSTSVPTIEFPSLGQHRSTFGRFHEPSVALLNVFI